MTADENKGATRDYGQLARWSARVMWAGYGALLVALTLNTLVVPSCGRQPNTVVWMIACVPLLAFLPAMIKHNVRACAWLCFILLFYFLLAVPVAMACVNPFTAMEVFIIVVLFVSTMLYIRWYSRYLKPKNTGVPNEQESVNHG